MPTPNIVLTACQDDGIEGAENTLRLIALREAVNIGIADIKAGRFKTFDSDEEIDQYLAKLTADAGAA